MKSMTGYGRKAIEVSGISLQVEVRQLNHRYLDAVLRFPEGYARWEQEFRTLVAERVERGRVEISLVRRPIGRKKGHRFNDAAISDALSALTHLKDHHGVPGVIDLPTILSVPGLIERFLVPGEPDDAEIEKALEAAGEALDEARTMREVEGERLASALAKELRAVEDGRQKIAGRYPHHLQEVRERLKGRLREIEADVAIDPDRVAAEIVLYAERSDVAEEIARIDSHRRQIEDLFATTESVGKRLDFLCQELLREVNTVGSKARDGEIAAEVVKMKAAIERCREQAQNIE